MRAIFSLYARSKVTKSVSINYKVRRERRAEAESNRSPSAYQPNASSSTHQHSSWYNRHSWLGVKSDYIYIFFNACVKKQQPNKRSLLCWGLRIDFVIGWSFQDGVKVPEAAVWLFHLYIMICRPPHPPPHPSPSDLRCWELRGLATQADLFCKLNWGEEEKRRGKKGRWGGGGGGGGGGRESAEDKASCRSRAEDKTFRQCSRKALFSQTDIHRITFHSQRDHN